MNLPPRLVSVRNTVKTRASIIIVTRNSTRTIRPCLESVLRYLGRDDEVIVIDNASTDGSPDLVEEIYLAASLNIKDNMRVRLRFSRNSSDLGFSRAANRGMAMANGQYFTLVNPDVIVTAGWLDSMIGHMIEHLVGAIGPLVDIGDSPQNAAIFLPERQVLEARTWEEEEVSTDALEAVAAAARERYSGRHKEVSYLFTSCMLIPRATIEEVGPLEEGLFIGGEDLEFAWRLSCSGLRLLVAADALVSMCGDPYFDDLPRNTAAYLGQLAVNRVAEKIAAYYLARNETPPGADRIWEIENFRPSQQAISVAVVAESERVANVTVQRLQSQAAVPLKVTVMQPDLKSLNHFLSETTGLAMIIEAGTGLNPGWMSRVAAAGELLASPAIFFPSWVGYSDEEPVEHGPKIRPLSDPASYKRPICLIFSLEDHRSIGSLDEHGSDWREALLGAADKLVLDGAQSVQIADLLAKELLL